MKNKKTIYLWPIFYALVTSIAGSIIRNVYNLNYAEAEYIEKLLPVLVGLVGFLGICFYLQRKNLEVGWKKNGKIILYLAYILPLGGIIAYYWMTSGNLSVRFFLPFIATFFVGIGEELVSRRILFIGLLKEHTFLKALLISSLVFGLLHGLNVFSGMPINQAIMQVAITFLAGIFLALMYDYTRNFYLVAIQHWLWDYLLLSGAAKVNPLIGLLIMVMMAIQILLTIVLLVRRFKKKKTI